MNSITSQFDEWTEQDEENAIRDFAAHYKVRHIIKDGQFWALTPGGRVYKLPLALSISDFERLSTASDTESISGLKHILAAFAGDTQARDLEHEPLQVAFNLLQDYGATLARTQGVEDLGKSQASAGSSAPTSE